MLLFIVMISIIIISIRQSSISIINVIVSIIVVFTP